ncbi:MAG: hypothetical protein Q7U05_13200 [Polaromonas sp.]|nr:hypothetical protein [Polaromonas sp.]
MTPLSKTYVRFSLRSLCISLALLFNLSSGFAQTCPTAKTITSKDLYGQWAVEFTGPPRGLPAKATLQLQQHTEYTESLAGTLLRDLSAAPGGQVPGHSPRAQVVGDLEGVLLMLDESSNGINLTASWDGKVVDGSCGKTIQGVWKDLSSDAAPDAADVPFTLRQINAW